MSYSVHNSVSMSQSYAQMKTNEILSCISTSSQNPIICQWNKGMNIKKFQYKLFFLYQAMNLYFKKFLSWVHYSSYILMLNYPPPNLVAQKQRQPLITIISWDSGDWLGSSGQSPTKSLMCLRVRLESSQRLWCSNMSLDWDNSNSGGLEQLGLLWHLYQYVGSSHVLPACQVQSIWTFNMTVQLLWHGWGRGGEKQRQRKCKAVSFFMT